MKKAQFDGESPMAEFVSDALGSYFEGRAMGGTVRFRGVPADKINDLVNLEAVDPEGRQNESPTARELLGFASEFPSTTYTGYWVMPPREDARITIDGFEVPIVDISTTDIDRIGEEWKPSSMTEREGRLFVWWD